MDNVEEIVVENIIDSKEYIEGTLAYPEEKCPYPITTIDGKRYRWYMGYYSRRYAGFAHIPETDILDVDIKNRLPQKVKK